MKTSELKVELHRIIDEVKDNRILEAIHVMLSSQVTIFAHSTEGSPLTRKDFDTMIESSEEDIRAGRLTTQKKLKEEIKSWRKK